VRSCDTDGHLDAGESGVLTVRLVNGGWATLSNTSVKVTSSDPRLTVGNAGLVTLAPLEPYAEASVTFPVSSVTGAAARGLLKLTITPSDPDAYKPSVDLPIELLYNYDDVPQSAATDDCESAKPAWSVPTNVLAGVWSQSGDAENHVWHGDDMGARSDESLVSPDLVVSAVESFVISFRDDPDIELDINALAGRKAWGGESSGYPDYERVSIDLGTKLAGKTVKIRFRIGTDEGAGAPGWDIDDLAFGTGAASGITNTPFSSIRDDAAACEPPPAAQ
jgi:hypothetical protein